MEKGPLIGRGRTADIYAWKDHQALKLFHEGCSAGMVERELKIARLVQAAGLPVPAVEGDGLSVDGRRGILYERVDGPSMLAVVRARPWKAVAMGRLMANLHAAVHQCATPDLPLWRESLEHALHNSDVLPELMKQAALGALAQLPDGDALCHGDFHPDNVIMGPRGPVIIDWMTAARCNPLADVARTSLILRMGEPPAGTRGLRIINLIRNSFHSAYLTRYLQLRPVARQNVDAWQLPIAAARLREQIPAEKSKLLRLIDVSLQPAAASR